MRGRRPKEEVVPLAPIREWTNASGEDMVAVHPLYIAFLEHYRPGKKPSAGMDEVNRRLHEIGRGERRLHASLGQRILELDREQQANGCPDENMTGLVKLLESPPA